MSGESKRACEGTEVRVVYYITICLGAFSDPTHSTDLTPSTPSIRLTSFFSCPRRFLQSSASGASLPPPITEPPTVVPKADSTTTVPTTTVPTATPVTAKPTEVPTPAPEATDAPTESSANVAPLTEPDGGTNDPNDVVVETTASGGGVAIPLLSVLGVVGIASLVVARRSYLAKANSDADSASSDSQESSQS